MLSDVTNNLSVPSTSFTTEPCYHFETVRTSNLVNSSGMLEPAKLQSLLKRSCSRRNFAVNMVREMFDEDTMKRSNVAGKLGKLKMNPVLIEYIKSLTFQYYPIEPFEKEKTEWAKCVIAIDEGNRRLNNKPKRNQ